MHSFKKLKWSFLHVIKFLFLAIGKSWNDFYGWMLNYQDRKITIEEILSRTNVDGKYKGFGLATGRIFLRFYKETWLQ